MRLQLTRNNEEITAYLSGELDHHTAAEIRSKIDTAVLQQSCRQLVLDFSNLSFMDSSGIGLIMGRYRLMSTAGGQLTITGASPRMETLLRMAGMEKLPIWGKQNAKKEG